MKNNKLENRDTQTIYPTQIPIHKSWYKSTKGDPQMTGKAKKKKREKFSQHIWNVMMTLAQN